MNPMEIQEALAEQGYEVRRVTNVPHREGDQLRPLPLFRVELEQNSQNPKIYELRSILQIRITVESFKPRTIPPHCRNCQRVGHTKKYCLRAPRCIKCGDNHSSDQCTQPRTEKCKCANCSGPHPANFKGCKAFKQKTMEPHRAVDEITRRTMSIPTPQNVSQTPPEVTQVMERKSYSSAVKSSQNLSINFEDSNELKTMLLLVTKLVQEEFPTLQSNLRSLTSRLDQLEKTVDSRMGNSWSQTWFQ